MIEQQSELLRYIKVVSKRKKIISAGILICVLASFVITSFIDPRYEASAQIIITQGQSVQNVQSSGESYQALLLSERVAKTFNEMIGGRILAERVIAKLELPLLTEDLRKKVSARLVKDTQLIEISITDNDPILTRDIANTYANEFVAMAKEVSPASVSLNVKVVEPAVVPMDPIAPKPVQNVFLGLLIGAFASIGIALLLEMLDVTVKEQEDIEDLLDLPSLGKVPLREQPSLLAGDDILASDAYRGVRTNLQYINFNQSIKTLIVTSANRSEGKSTFSSNLAVVFAQAGQNVLLIEADLRRPSQSGLFGLSNYKGLANVLIGSETIDSVVQETGIDGLSVMMSGPIPPNPSDLLNSVKLTAVLSGLRDRFDLVIIDSPPVLAVTDTVILSTKADAVLLLTHHAKTKKSEIVAAKSILGKVGARIIGFVINGNNIPLNHDRYYYQPTEIASRGSRAINQ